MAEQDIKEDEKKVEKSKGGVPIKWVIIGAAVVAVIVGAALFMMQKPAKEEAGLTTTVAVVVEDTRGCSGGVPGAGQMATPVEVAAAEKNESASKEESTEEPKKEGPKEEAKEEGDKKEKEGEGGPDAKTEKPKEGEVPAAASKPASKPDMIYDMDPFMVNLADTIEPRFASITMKLKLGHALCKMDVDQMVPEIRDSVLMLIGSKDYATLRTSPGKLELRDEVMARVVAAVGEGKVEGAYFTEFILQ